MTYLREKSFLLYFEKIGQYADNFTLIPNLKTKLRNSAPIIKSYFQKTTKKQFFENNFFVMRFFKFCLWTWNQCKILRFLVPILTYLKKKVFSSIFGKILSGLYSSFLWFCLCWEGGRGTFSSKMPRTMSNLPDFSSSSIFIRISMCLYFIYDLGSNDFSGSL